MVSRGELAVRKFLEGCNCAQSVLYPFCTELGLEPQTALKAASGFGGGMGRHGEICGALSGGILALGLRFGGADRPAIESAYAKVRELIGGFRRRHGEILCRRLLEGIDLATEEGHRRFKELGLREKTCRRCVQTAADLVEGLLGRP